MQAINDPNFETNIEIKKNLIDSKEYDFKINDD